FQSYAHHTDLHSFPTRRSSDLEGKGHWFFPLPRPKKLVVKPGQFVVLLRGRYSAVESLNIVRCEPAISPACPVDSGSPSGHTNRSEEHTSELQSLRHLVCRLLL